MMKLSTQCMDKMNKPSDKEQEQKTSPRKQTLDYLEQFARVYCSKKTFNAGHCGFVMN